MHPSQILKFVLSKSAHLSQKIIALLIHSYHLPFVFRKVEPDFPPAVSHTLHLAKDEINVSPQPQLFLNISNCSA